MSLQTSLHQVLLFLLFLHLSPLGGRSHPLDVTSPTPQLSGIEELLDRLPDKVPELQAGQVAPGPLQQSHGPAEAGEAEETDLKIALAPQENAHQAPQGPHSPKMMRDSGCFGQRLDRIGYHSGLGCNVLRRH
ncbi:natriuretic peptides B [Carlito syrichta]|uniref:Natriuretic peptides B n=1 Tax=Carlito syrichta TaxID=1868482 RepID=A0A1U7TZX4_CARSF|nr:natriuretic peptides B [Carlito syrichta]